MLNEFPHALLLLKERFVIFSSLKRKLFITLIYRFIL